MNNMKKEQLRLYAVTDRTWLGNETLYEQVEESTGRWRYSGTAAGEGTSGSGCAEGGRRIAGTLPSLRSETHSG